MIHGGNEGGIVAGRTMNVSRGGLCADLESPVPNGVMVEVDLQLVFDDEAHSEPLRLAGRVVWCTPVDDAHQVGIAFRPLSAEQLEYLTMFLRYLDDTRAPRRPSRREIASVDDLFG